MARKFDCVIIKNELWVARDSGHHFLTKFTLSHGEWMIGNKRGCIWIKEHSIGILCPRVTMTMGYYENLNVKFSLKLRESNYKIIMEYASSQ